MRGFRSRSRRSPGAHPIKGARPLDLSRPANSARSLDGTRGLRGVGPGRVPVPVRSEDAALGRATRGLVGPARPDRTRRTGRRLHLPGIGRLGRIVTPGRAAGMLGMLASGFLFAFATGPTAFAVTRTEIADLTWTDPATVRQALRLPAGSNAFRLDTVPLEAALAKLPAVASADVSVRLPDAAIVVRIEERHPVLAWQALNKRFMADADGVIFAVVDRSVKLPAGVVVVDDRRQGAISLLTVGKQLDPVDLDVATRLGSLSPADVGSSARVLRVVVTDDDGFVVSTTDGWTAVFGFYSPATRPTDIIPGQVRLLRSLLGGREDTIRRIVLASATDGTYVPRTTPRP